MTIQWSLLIFGLLAGGGGGLMVFLGIAEILGVAKKTRFLSALVALIMLIVGGLFSVFHLGQPGNIMAAATNIGSFSGISVEMIALAINVVVVALYLVFTRGEGNASAAKAFGIVGIITGVIMAFVVGNGYVIFAQPYWNTIILPLGYLGSGLALGATLLVAIMKYRKEEETDLAKLKMWVIGAAVVQLVFFLAYGIAIGFVGNAVLYWGGAVIIGGVGTLVFAFLQERKNAYVYAACVSALIGGICFRAFMWTVGVGFINFFEMAATHGVF